MVETGGLQNTTEINIIPRAPPSEEATYKRVKREGGPLFPCSCTMHAKKFRAGAEASHAFQRAPSFRRRSFMPSRPILGVGLFNVLLAEQKLDHPINATINGKGCGRGPRPARRCPREDWKHPGSPQVDSCSELDFSRRLSKLSRFFL